MAVERKRKESILYKDFLTQREWHFLASLVNLSRGNFRIFKQLLSVSTLEIFDAKTNGLKIVITRFSSFFTNLRAKYVLQFVLQQKVSRATRTLTTPKIHWRRTPIRTLLFQTPASCKGKPPQEKETESGTYKKKNTFSCLYTGRNSMFPHFLNVTET